MQRQPPPHRPEVSATVPWAEASKHHLKPATQRTTSPLGNLSRLPTH